jgi:hypothetical protein
MDIGTSSKPWCSPLSRASDLAVDQGRTGVLSNARAKVYHLPPTKSSGHGVSIEQMFEIVVPRG